MTDNNLKYFLPMVKFYLLITRMGKTFKNYRNGYVISR